MSTTIRFLLNEEPVEVTGLSPQTTLLEFLRDVRRLTGTKEGCAEGDCGACTVVLAERGTNGLAWKAINACIRLLPSVHGKAVFTVESLAPDGTLHPVQQALVDCHASQCGFCTPGFAMSLFGLYKNAHAAKRADVDDALSGNLCRCTGYRPIVEAAQQMYTLPAPAGWRAPGVASDGSRAVSREEVRLTQALESLEQAQALDYVVDGERWSAPRTVRELGAACTERPNARIVAGMTDVALWVTKQHRTLGDVIYVGDVDDLRTIDESEDAISIGAGVELTVAMATLNRAFPELDEMWQRFASVPIRNSATLVGNIANGSPIGDSMPALMALGATVVLRHGAREREVPLDAFYPGFRQTARQPGEFLMAVRIPKRVPGLSLRAYKISKRFDQDISAVFACFALTQREGRIGSMRIGCGGVAAVPARARKTESLLVGAAWTAAVAEQAATALQNEFMPIDDMRASAAYRRVVLGNLLRRFFHETQSMTNAATRVHASDVLAAAT
jgi:xanthine dehydrogenase small subunit